MYLQEIEVEVARGKLDDWLVNSRVYLGALARQPGGVWFRILRSLDDENRFISMRAWVDKDASEQAWRSAELAWATAQAKAIDFYEGTAMQRREHEVLDFTWGPQGPGVFPGAGRVIHHVTGGVGPGKYAAWRPYSRLLFAVMARQPGVASFEIMRPAENPEKFLVLRSFMSAAEEQGAPGGANTPEEVRYALDPVEKYGLYAGAVPAVSRRFALHDMVWGMAGAEAMQSFMESLKPI